MSKALVDPVVLSMAVRYCLGRQSYAPSLIADQVTKCVADLGEQRNVIARDIAEWLADENRAPHHERQTWQELLARLEQP